LKVAAIFPDGTAGSAEEPDPIPKEDFVLVKLHSVPMCTEWHTFEREREPRDEREKRERDLPPEMIERIRRQRESWMQRGFMPVRGHEAAGEVVEVVQPGLVQVGDRVVVQPQYACGKCPLCLVGEHIHCQHGRDVRAITGSSTGTATMAQYMLKPDYLLSPIPDGVSYDHASMAVCGLGPTFGAMQQMQVNSLDTVLITGLGPVGLGGVINAHHLSARIIGVESVPYRADLAKKLGAGIVINPNDVNALKQIMDLTGGFGVDKAVDCSGNPLGERLCIDAARRKGQVTFVGQCRELTIGPSRDLISKGLTLRGSWHYNIGEYPKLMKIIQESSELLDRFITHTFPMSKIQEAFELQITGNCGKIVLHPWQ